MLFVVPQFSCRLSRKVQLCVVLCERLESELKASLTLCDLKLRHHNNLCLSFDLLRSLSFLVRGMT